MNARVNRNNLQALLDKAIAHQHAGENDEAKALFAQALKLDSNNAVALYSLSAIESTQGDYGQALVHIEKVVVSSPKFAQAHLAYSVILFNLGRMDEALKAVQKALKVEPTLPGAQAHLETVRLAHASHGGGNATPSNPQVVALNTQAIALQGAGQHAEAEALLRQALALDGKNFLTLYSLGVARSAQMDSPGALGFFSQACEASPHLPLGHFAKAKTLHDLGLAEDALAVYDQAIAADPHYMEAYTNKAALLQAMNRHHDALLCLTAATDINPDHVRALEGQGQLLGQYKQYTLATQAFAHALQVAPDYAYGEGHLMGARMSNCDWTDFDAAKARIIAGIEEGKLTCGPLTIMAITDDARIIRKCAELYAADKYQASPNPLWKGETYQHRKKRVGFISADFRVHPVGYLLIGLIEQFDKSQFELTGFFTGVSDDSDLWKRYRCAFDHYIDCHGMTSLDVAKLMRAMEIDVLIDLSGHTEGTRLDILAHRPAPAQVTYLGFPGTLGLPYIDYLISDPRIIPEELEQHYGEKILKLPHCYLPRDDSVVPSPETPNRSDFGLPEEGVVFCSFNHDYKINPPLFKVWMDLLKEVPGSVLWLMKLNEGAHTNLTQSARDHGVDPERIIFASRLPRVEDHLARYRLADVFIDTFPYNGHTTAGDALRAGLPVVSLCGGSFASRVAASLLHDVGMPELACYSFQEYHDKALQMATDEPIRTHYKGQLQMRIDEKVWPPGSITQSKEIANLIIQTTKELK
jgi:predicted O-linked N-acetylglucosamine transferase (SPINDLY family)